MHPRDIIVIGGSAGSIEPLKAIVKSLPAGFPASIFVVVHISPDSPTLLARLLARIGQLPALNPSDQEPIRRGHIYVARPDHHLTIEDGKVRVLRGPRENRHRPAIDPLLRTAARAYGPRVVGVVLSGLQDDGSAGLYAVKERGGICIVQDPDDAAWHEMPAHAIAYVQPHHVLAAGKIAQILVEFGKAGKSEAPMPKKNAVSAKSNKRSVRNAQPAPAGEPDANKDVAYAEEGQGSPSVFACPECHGVLWELNDGGMVRFRCRVGHSFGVGSLNQGLSEASESALWAAVRALEEKSALQRRLAEGMAFDANISSRTLDQSEADAHNARLIRDMIFHQNAELELESPNPENKPEPAEKRTA